MYDKYIGIVVSRAQADNARFEVKTSFQLDIAPNIFKVIVSRYCSSYCTNSLS